jgi:hypothetical protein
MHPTGAHTSLFKANMSDLTGRVFELHNPTGTLNEGIYVMLFYKLHIHGFLLVVDLNHN